MRTDKYTSEKDLVNAAKAGDKNAFEVLLDKSNTSLQKLLAVKITDYNHREEVMQCVRVSAFMNIKSFRGESSFNTWIIRIALNQIYNYYRQRKKYSYVQLDESIDVVIPNETKTALKRVTDPVNIVILAEENKEVLDIITNLPIYFKYKLVFKLVYVYNHTTYEVADILGISHANVAVILARVRAILSDELIKRKILNK